MLGRREKSWTMGQVIRGRCISLKETENKQRLITIRNEAGTHSIVISEEPASVSVGDIVQIHDGSTQVLTPHRQVGSLREKRLYWTQLILDPRRLHALEVRARVESAIREFFNDKKFREVRTPLMVHCPGMEPHIRPFSLENSAFLPTSPEFAMKRLLVGGLEKIFQICQAFRKEPMSNTHHPEFTMLEWYRAYAGYEDIMRDTEELFAFIANKLFGKSSICFQGRVISLATPWPRLKIRDLFLQHAGVDLVQSHDVEYLRIECRRLGVGTSTSDTWDDLYFKIWLNLIEPKLPSDQAVFVLRYPPSQAALSVTDRDPDGSDWAKRFEVYAGGLELGNAFEELTDPLEQHRRFVEDMKLREIIYGPDFPKNPIDEEFLEALHEGMPPSGGIAMGVDRIVMLFADEPEIEKTIWLRSYCP
jgi:elongation factor P--(R)-beta-lysine ligase